MLFLGQLEKEIAKRKALNEEELDDLHFLLLAHLPYSPGFTSSYYYLFVNAKSMLAGMRYESNEQVIAETEAYLEGKGMLERS